MHVKQTVYVTSLLFTIGLSEYAENVNNSDFEKVFFLSYCFYFTSYHLAKCYRFLGGHFFRKTGRKEHCKTISNLMVLPLLNRRYSSRLFLSDSEHFHIKYDSLIRLNGRKYCGEGAVLFVMWHTRCFLSAFADIECFYRFYSNARCKTLGRRCTLMIFRYKPLWSATSTPLSRTMPLIETKWWQQLAALAGIIL